MSDQKSNSAPAPATGFNVARHSAKKPKLTTDQVKRLLIGVALK